MLYLWIFGNNVEDALGHMRFIFFYLVSGLVAAAFQFSNDPSSSVPMIGASGAISGVLGAYLVLYPYARIKTLLIIFIFFKVIELPAILLLTVWFLIQVFYSTSMEGVAWFAHIGGFIFGLLTIKLFVRKSNRKSRPVRVSS
jgi:membrane associated rhomboid family serine protease